MSIPPPPGHWGTQRGPAAPGQSGPSGANQGFPTQGYQQHWYPPPGRPNKSGSTKWIALAVASVALAATVIVVVLHGNSSHSSSALATSASASGIASASDTGPVTIITDDPSCATWSPIFSTLAQTTQQNGWDKRDPAVPASAWTSDQRKMYENTTTAMRHAADQTAAPAKLTPHRVMRELYEQSIAYWHAYADSVSSYTPVDDNLARVTTTSARSIQAICNAITHGSAASRGPLVDAAQPPTHVAPPRDGKPTRFLVSTNSVCSMWDAEIDSFNAATIGWSRIDTSIPASKWDPEQKALNDAFGPALSSTDQKLEQLGREGKNPTLEDFAVLIAAYGAAFVQSLPTYVPSDQDLYDTASFGMGVVSFACRAVGG